MGEGYFYFIKWKQGLLIADRAIQSSISAQTLNKAGYYTGSEYRVLSEAEFNSAMADDFGGNFKFSTNPQDTFHANGVYSISKGPVTGYVVLLQGGRQIGTAYCYNDLGGKFSTNTYGFTEVRRLEYNFTAGYASDALVYSCSTFLPCMEYVDNSKSTNIFY